MPRLGKPIMPEDTIIRGLILDSRDLFSEEKYEDRMDLELAMLTQDFKKRGLVDANKVRTVVNEFIGAVEVAFRKLEDAKRKAEQEEINNIDKIRSLLVEGKKINVKSLKKELEAFGMSLKSNTLSALRRNRRRERQLRRGRAPFGFVLKKLRQSKYLDKEVARKAFRIGEHTLKEPQMFSEIDYLLSMLNKNPNKEILEQLKERVYRLTEDYEGNLDDFLTVEVDIEIEESRKLHRIDHYIAFLKMISNLGYVKEWGKTYPYFKKRGGPFEKGQQRDFFISHKSDLVKKVAYTPDKSIKELADDLISRLNELKKKVNYWVYQDSIDAKRLQQYATKSLEYGEQLLKTSERSGEFPEIAVEKISIYNAPALKIFNPERLQEGKVNRGIVLVHGAFGTKEGLLTLGKRLATKEQDFLVVSIDLPQHGENRALFKFGIACEFIHEAVVYLRSQGMRNVGVVGHSFGAMSTLFAICGYNLKIENEFFDITSRLIKQIENVVRALEGITEKSKELRQSDEHAYEKQYSRAVYHSTLLSKEYKYLKQKLLEGLEYMFRGSGISGKIDAAVLLSPPLTSQLFFAPQAAYVFQHLPKLLSRPGARWVTGQITKSFFKKFEKQEGEEVVLPRYINEKDKAQLVGAVIPDLYDTFHYVGHMKNPYDFMEAIDYFCDKVMNPDMSTEFFRYYREFIRRTPKLYIYGLEDMDLLKPLWAKAFSFTKTHQAELEDHYKKFGETEIIRIPNVNHMLNKEGKEKQFEGARLPRITYKIVTFFNQYLGRGRLV